MVQVGTEDPVVSLAKARVGSALNAKWTIERLLGVGGMASVYAARHRNGSRAAVKVLSPKLAAIGDIHDRFLKEGRIANAVDHPARVRVLDDDVSDDREPFLVMELLEGRTLEDHLVARGGKISAEEILAIIDPVLDLLAHCHAVGIVHRDIKPGNVFLTNEGDVRVLDFGIARMREHASGKQGGTLAGTTLGTPAYMSPEQALGRVDAIDGRADIFSVGACMYTSLTGTHVHTGPTAEAAVVHAATKQAPSIGRKLPDLPAEVIALVDKALAFDREDRWPDAGAMRAEVAKLRSGKLSSGDGRAQGVVVRGNDSVDDEVSVEPKTQVDRLRAIWKVIGISLSDLRQYGWSHPRAVKSVRTAFEAVVDGLRGDASLVRWDVGAGAFLHEGEPIWSPDRSPFDRIPYQLFGDGVRRVQLKEGITEDEFKDLLAIFLREVSSTAFSDEDDSVTALWDSRFEHVAYIAVDSFAQGTNEEDGPLELEQSLGEIVSSTSAATRIDKDWDELSSRAQALELNLGAVMKESAESARAVSADAMARATLGAQMNLTDEQWRERYVDAFAAAYVDGKKRGDIANLEAALADWTAEELEFRRHASVFEMSEVMLAALARGENEASAKAIERDLAKVFFSVKTLGPVLIALAKEGKERSDEPPKLDPSVLGGLERAFSALQEDGLVGLACECIDAYAHDGLRSMLLAYVTRFAKGNEATLLGSVAKVGPELGVALARILCGLGQHAGLLNAALSNKHLAVRLEALTLMPPELAERVAKELGMLLAEDDARVRLEALKVAADRGMWALGPRVVIRIKQPSFHLLPISERRAWLEALVKLNAGRAEEIAIELLTGSQVIPNENVEETRVLAAEVLARTASKEALAAAQRAAKKRWWNTSRVREAAERAEAAIAAAMAARPTRGG